MDCGAFRDNHAAFLDEAIGDHQLVAMQRHLVECESCAEHDTTVRRALLLFRNMPPIEPSPEFAARLRTRLRAAREERRIALFGRAGLRGPSVVAFASLAAGVILAGYITVAASDWATPSRVVTLAPVVATASDPAEDGGLFGVAQDGDPMAVLTTPAAMASVSTGIPVWSAAALAARAPARFAAAQLRLTSLGR